MFQRNQGQSQATGPVPVWIGKGTGGAKEVEGAYQRRGNFDKVKASFGRGAVSQTDYGGIVGRGSQLAILMPEAQNESDANAVAVTVNGLTVGHLAPAYSATLQSLAAQGVQVCAMVHFRGTKGDASAKNAK